MLQRHLLLFILCIIGLLTLHPVFAANFSNNQAIESAITQEINHYREQHHLPALSDNKTLTFLARKHSEDMANGTVPFGHAGFYQRIKHAFSVFKHARGAAENVAYTSENPLHVVPLWIGSKGHRRNIEGHFNVTGVGIAHGAHGKTYATQLFLLAPNSH